MKAYQLAKNKLSQARREFVIENGWKMVLPTSLWPKLPNREFAAWVPPIRFLSDEQKLEPMHQTYVDSAMALVEMDSGNPHCNSQADIEFYSDFLKALQAL